MKKTHTEFKRGQNVFIQLKNGETYTDRFIEAKSRYIFTQYYGKQPIKDVRQISIARVMAK